MICKLENIAQFQKGFAFKSKDFKESGIKVVKVSNLTDESIDTKSCLCIDGKLVDTYRKYELKQDDIIITTVGSWPNNPASIVGKVVRVPKKIEKAVLNQNAVRVRNSDKINQQYLYYLLRTNDFRNYIIGTAQGSANQASITQKDIKNFLVDIPEIDKQKIIAHILLKIDEKIELNNKINENLQSISQLLFKHWFVDFEFPNEEGLPYKSSGGEMADSELGMIPKGWESKRFDELFTFIKGKKPIKVGTLNLVGYKDYLTIGVINGSEELFASTEKAIMVNNEVMMVMDGASSGDTYQGNKGILGSTLSKLSIKNNNISNEFLYTSVKFYENDIKCHLTGSAIPHTDKEYVKRINIVLPVDNYCLKNIQQNFINYKNMINNNLKENKILSNLRDTLLPKLMNGEIDLSNIEINQ